MWRRTRDSLADETLHDCVLAYVSDMFTGLAAVPGLRQVGPPTSIDHAVLFYRRVALDDWVALKMLLDDSRALGTPAFERLLAERPGFAEFVEWKWSRVAPVMWAAIAPQVLPRLAEIYLDKGVELRGDDAARALVPQMKPATEQDWYTEWLAPVLGVRIVRDLDEAMDHIAKYGSQHTDAIVTEDDARAQRFLREVDSSSVMVNASTRLADGFEYGLGAEVGISTDKLHARGPVGLEGLTSLKYVVFGDGQIRT